MKRKVFVGSSTEALDKAEHVCQLLNSFSDVESELWTETFVAGFLTFDSLEEMLRRCDAAVFIATPDDDVTIRGRPAKVPRANVMLEFGLLAGRFGLHSVAVCQYGGAEMPSDLRGLTVITMDPSPVGPGAAALSSPVRQLEIWSSRLLATASNVARTEVVHGYTGRWTFVMNLQVWRDFPIAAPGVAMVSGYFDIFIPSSGEVGRGFSQARLTFKLPLKPPLSGFYEGEYHTAHEVTNAICNRDGSLEMTTQAFALQSRLSTGTPPPELADVERFLEPWSARWTLKPSTDSRTMVGVMETDGGVRSRGTVRAQKPLGF